MNFLNANQMKRNSNHSFLFSRLHWYALLMERIQHWSHRKVYQYCITDFNQNVSTSQHTSDRPFIGRPNLVNIPLKPIQYVITNVWIMFDGWFFLMYSKVVRQVEISIKQQDFGCHASPVWTQQVCNKVLNFVTLIYLEQFRYYNFIGILIHLNELIYLQIHASILAKRWVVYSVVMRPLLMWFIQILDAWVKKTRSVIWISIVMASNHYNLEALIFQVHTLAPGNIMLNQFTLATNLIF